MKSGKWLWSKWVMQISGHWQEQSDSTLPTVQVKTQSPVHFPVVSTYVDRLIQYLAQSILRKYATHKNYWFGNLTYIMLLHYLGKKQFLVFSILNGVYSGSMWMAPKWVVFGAEMRMQTWKWTELLQMLKVTTTGSHAHSQALKQHLHSHLVGCSNAEDVTKTFWPLSFWTQHLHSGQHQAFKMEYCKVSQQQQPSFFWSMHIRSVSCHRSLRVIC